MTKLTLRAIATAMILFAAPAAFAQNAPASCPAGYLDGGLVINATGDQQRICTPDPAAAPPAPVTVDTHGRRDISLAQLRGMMSTFGAARIAAADLVLGSPERAAVLDALGPLWVFSPGVETPGLLYHRDNAGVTHVTSGSNGTPLGVRVEKVDGTFVFFAYPGDNECAVNDRPASPNMWRRICQAAQG